MTLMMKLPIWAINVMRRRPKIIYYRKNVMTKIMIIKNKLLSK